MEYKMNPWRKGVQAGRDYVRAVHAYNTAVRAGEPATRPERPVCPYAMGSNKHSGSYQWTDGYRTGVQREEGDHRKAMAEARAAKKAQVSA
jgi:hypothetical protein